MKGYVKWFNEPRKWGFIMAETNEEHFFHENDWQGGEKPKLDQEVEFELGKDRKGRIKAINIKLISVEKGA